MDDRSLPAHTKATVSMSFDFGFGPVSAHRHTNGGGWVADTAIVEATAFVGPEAQVYGEAQLYGEARVYGEAQVCDKARVCGEAQVYGEAQLYGEAQVYGEAQLYGEARVYGEAQVYDKAQVCGEAQVYDKAQVCGEAQVYGEARVCHTPILISCYEFSLTILDNQVHIGCKTVKLTDDLTPDIFPEESCPRLRAAAPNIIPLVLAHWACCKTGWTTLPLPDDDDDDDDDE